MRLSILLITMLLPFSAFANIDVSTVNGSKEERQIKQTLETLYQQHDIARWIYTDTIQVDENARTPHSHPVLTMNTGAEYLQNDTKVLSTFLHEQFHWHVIINGKGSKEAFRAEIKKAFPNVRAERPYGSGSEGGTLSHLVVCYLEFKALSALIGKQQARENLASNGYYTWVYATILSPQNQPKLEALLDRFGLNFEH